jgi:hypothetical protein
MINNILIKFLKIEKKKIIFYTKNKIKKKPKNIDGSNKENSDEFFAFS